MRRFLVICAVLFGVTMVGPVSTVYAGDEPSVAEQIEVLSAEGAELFQDGQYEQAIEKFEQAYELQPIPNLLYNIGHCYEQLEDWEQARHYYEEFIRSPDIDSEARDHAMDRIQSLREIEQLEAQEDQEDEQPDEAVAEQPEQPEDEDEPVEVEEIEEPSMVPAYATLGTGVGLLGAGLVTGLLANGNAGRIDDTELGYEDRLDAQNRARTQGLVADVFYGGAIAAGVTGAFLMWSATRQQSAHDSSSREHAVTPWIGKDNAGIGVYLDF